ncbi:MAG: hypothetical protein QOG71_2306 [Pyrinomonadaceae bacterium]|nr:hypothetical protein [Pyrinomonadaceae bacterium]
MSSPPEAASPPQAFASVWGQAEVLTPHVLQRGTFVSTPNGDVISILFDQATPEPGTLHSPPASPPGQPASPPDSGAGRTVGSPPHEIGSPPLAPHAAWCGTLRIPLKLEDGTCAVWFKSDLRVFVAKDVGARVLLLADLAGQSFVREFPYEAASGVGGEDSGLHTFEIVHQAQSLPAEGYTFSMLILVERLAADKAALVSLDSLDITVNPNLKASLQLEPSSPPSSPPDSPPDSSPGDQPGSPRHAGR